jgi:LacI family transcriptional regulator, fructose operon transcriptional repressor
VARIQDVAARAKVSVASVSRALAGPGAVSDDVRRRVLEAVKALDYRPDLAARRLRSRRTDTIGLLVSDVRNPFFTDVSRAVEDAASAHRMRLILCNTDEDPAREAACLELMRDENVSGVILSPSLRLLARFDPSDHPFPIVLVDRCERDTAADAVVIDNVAAGHEVTEHVLATGRRRVACVYGVTSATGRQRLEGYTLAMKARDLRPASVGVQPVTEAAREATRTLIDGAPPEAIVASSGLVLMGVFEALRAAGLGVPRDVALAGFDDLPWTRLVDPGLTVVAQPTYEIGRTATELLLQRIAQPQKPVRRVVLRATLVPRGSTAGQAPGRSGTRRRRVQPR